MRQGFVRAVSRPVADVFDNLAGHPERWAQWFTVVRTCRYDGEPPFGAGSIRHLGLRGGILARERILAWDEPVGIFAYRVDETNAPGVRAMLERWNVEALPGDRTRIRWLIAIDGAGPARFLLSAAHGRINHVFHHAMRRLERHAP